MFQSKLKEKDINLLEVYTQKKKETSKNEMILKYAIPPIVIVLLFGSLTGYFRIRQHMTQNELDDVNQQIDKIIAEQDASGKDEKYALLQTLKQQLTNLNTIYTNMNSYPELSKEVLNGLFTATGTSVDLKSINFEQDSAIISLNVSTKYLSQTDQVIRRLKDTNFFSDVTYSGYSSSEILSESATSGTTTNTTPDYSNLTDDELKAAIIAGLIGNNTNTNTEANTKPEVIGREYSLSITCTLKKEVTE